MKTETVNIQIPTDLRDEIKIIAIKHRLSLKEITKLVLSDFARKHQTQPGIVALMKNGKQSC